MAGAWGGALLVEINLVHSLWKTVRRFLKKINKKLKKKKRKEKKNKSTTTIQSGHPTSKGLKAASPGGLFAHLPAALFTTAHRCRDPKGPSADGYGKRGPSAQGHIAQPLKGRKP